MTTHIYKSLSPVANVDDSILKITLPGRRCFKKVLARELISELSDHTGLPDFEIEVQLEGAMCLGSQERDQNTPAYVIEHSFEIENVQARRKENILYDHNIMSNHHAFTDNLIKILRLCSRGNIDLYGHYVFEKNGDSWEPDSSMLTIYTQYDDLFYVSDEVAEKAHHLVNSIELPFQPAYIELAFENFNISYSLDNLHLAFLSLMIALEVLFNVGRSELRYRVCRNCAMLLAKDRNEFTEYFKELKCLYDKRSKLVHTGNISSIDYRDICVCRRYLRMAILRLQKLNLEKDELCSRLDIFGFRRDVL